MCFLIEKLMCINNGILSIRKVSPLRRARIDNVHAWL